MNIKRSIVVLIAISYYISTYANQPIVRNFTRKDYKSGTQNWSIAQDEKNRMCFANNSGLLIFDGKNWQTLPISNGTNVRSVAYGGNGRFYASTFNEFGYFENDKNGVMQYYSLTTKLKIKPSTSNELYKIHVSDKMVYFQGERAVYKYDGRSAKKYTFDYKIDASAIVHNILFVASRQNGLFMLNGNLFVRIQGSEMLVNKKVSAILPYTAKQVLIVTSMDGVFLYNGLSIIPFTTGIDGFLKSNQVFCAASNGQQIVYGTVQRGVVIQNISNKAVTYINTFSGLQNNTVLNATFDNQQNLWLGLDNGIDYIMLNNPIRNIFGTNNLYGAGYSSFIRKNTLYLGTNQGLYTTAYPLRNSDIPIQLQLIRGMEGQVWCLTEIDNTLFCGDDLGAFIISGSNIERIQGLPGTWAFKSVPNHPELILGSSYQGLFMLRKSGAKWRLSHFLKGNFNESSPMFEQDTDGSIWFSHWQRGLYRLQLNAAMDSIVSVSLYNEKKGLPANRNNTFFRVGNELVFSSERGFYSYNAKSDSMVTSNKWNQLFNATPSYMRLHAAPNGDVWCVSGRFIGLARKQKSGAYSMDSLTYRILQPKIIIGFEHFNFVDNNNLIINTEDGFSWINTSKPAPARSNFNVFISSIIATNGSGSTAGDRHFNSNPNVENTFSNRYNSLRFEFNAPEYRNEGLVEYSYQLEGYDKSWSDFSTDNIKEYNQLPRGKYVFRVKARSMLEIGTVSCTYKFSIAPAWYESKLAFGIYTILFILLIVAVILLINHRSKQGALEMEKIKELEIQEQKKAFEEENTAKKKEIKELKNQQLQYELRHKAQELASSTMNLIRKNEILLEIADNIAKTTEDIKKNVDNNTVLSRLTKMERHIKQNIEQDKNWKKFEANFDLVYENYLKRLGEAYPQLNVSDKKICAYIKMDLSSKDMAPLLNMSVRSIETNRYRIRQKLALDREVNLADFLQKF